MKKKLLFFAVFATAFGVKSQAQTFPNASFETWHSYSVNTGIFPPNPIALTAPTGWCGVDSLVASVTPFAAAASVTLNPQQQLFQSALFHSGTSSAEVKSINMGDSIGNVPGVLVNAKIDIDITAAATALTGGGTLDLLSLLKYTGGTAVTAQVDTVTAWISLDSTTNLDEGIIVATTVKASGDSTIPVGIGTVVVTRGSAAFREIKIPLVYTNTTVPEKLIVAFMSSNYNDTMHAGNSMKVDDVSYSYKANSGTAIVQPLLSENNMLVYPNPTKNQIYFNLNASVKPADFNLSVYDVNGRLISSEQLKQAVNTKNVSGWAKGTYYYQLSDAKIGQSEKGQFIVQ